MSRRSNSNPSKGDGILGENPNTLESGAPPTLAAPKSGVNALKGSRAGPGRSLPAKAQPNLSSNSSSESDSSDSEESSSAVDKRTRAKKVDPAPEANTQFSVTSSDNAGLRMKIAIPRTTAPKEKPAPASNANKTGPKPGAGKRGRPKKKVSSNESSSSSFCSECSTSDSDSQDPATAKVRKKTPKHKKGVAKTQKKSSTSSEYDSSSESEVPQPKPEVTTPVKRKRGRPPKAQTVQKSIKPEAKSSLPAKPPLAKSNSGMGLDGAEGGSSSDNDELPALVSAAIRRVESFDSDSEALSKTLPSITSNPVQYTSSLLRDFMAKTQMISGKQELKEITVPDQNATTASTAAGTSELANPKEPPRRKRGRPKKQQPPPPQAPAGPIPTKTDKISSRLKLSTSDSPDSGILSISHSPTSQSPRIVNHRKSIAGRPTNLNPGQAIKERRSSVPKINISNLEKTIYATERVLYPPRKLKRGRPPLNKNIQLKPPENPVNQKQTGSLNASVDPQWKKIDINKKFRRPSTNGYKSDCGGAGGSVICSKVLAAQCGYTSDYGSVRRNKHTSGYRSDYSTKSRKSGYRSDYSVKGEGCGYRSDCSTRHRKKVRRKRRSKSIHSGPASKPKTVITDQDLLLLAGLTLGNSSEEETPRERKKVSRPQTTAINPQCRQVNHSSVKKADINQKNNSSFPSIIPSNFSKFNKADFDREIAKNLKLFNNNNNNNLKTLPTKDGIGKGKSSIKMTPNLIPKSDIENFNHFDSNVLPLGDFHMKQKSGIGKSASIRSRRSSAVSRCSSRSTSSRHPFRRHRRKRLKSKCEGPVKVVDAKFKIEIDELINIFTTSCHIIDARRLEKLIEKEVGQKEKELPQPKPAQKRATKKRKGSENAEASQPGKRRNKKLQSTQSPDDHKLPLKKRHYLLTPGEKAADKEKKEELKHDEKEKTTDDRKVKHSEDDKSKPPTRAVTPKKRHLLEQKNSPHSSPNASTAIRDLSEKLNESPQTPSRNKKPEPVLKKRMSICKTSSPSTQRALHNLKEADKLTEKAKDKGKTRELEKVKEKEKVKSIEKGKEKISTKEKTVEKPKLKEKDKLKNKEIEKPKEVEKVKEIEKEKESTKEKSKEQPKSKELQKDKDGKVEKEKEKLIDKEKGKDKLVEKEKGKDKLIDKEKGKDKLIDKEKGKEPMLSPIPPPGVFEPSIDLELQIPISKIVIPAGIKFGKKMPLLSPMGKKKRRKVNRTGFPTTKKKKKNKTTSSDSEKALLDSSLESDPSKCDRVPKEGEASANFIERNLMPRLSVVSLERLQEPVLVKRTLRSRDDSQTNKKRARDESQESVSNIKKAKTIEAPATPEPKRVRKMSTAVREVTPKKNPTVVITKLQEPSPTAQKDIKPATSTIELEQEPLPIIDDDDIESIRTDTPSSEISERTGKKSNRWKKKYLVAGLFSDYYKEVAGQKPSKEDQVQAPALLPPPPYCEKFFRQNEIDFQLPYDLWHAHENQKLPGRDTVASWNFKKIRANVYIDVRPNPNTDQPSCSCKPQSDCGDDCLNRVVYTECNPDFCPCGDKCQNTKIQKHEYASGLEKYMTENKGWGVRTKQAIKKSSFIIEYLGEVVTEREFKERMATLYVKDMHHYCLHLDGGLVIDGHRMGSDCRFVNHSCTPNCEMQKWSVNGLSRMCLFALRDIKSGEELTYDYNFALYNPLEGQPCLCNTRDCRGVIGGKSQRVTKPQEGAAATSKEDTTTNKGRARKRVAKKSQCQISGKVRASTPLFHIPTQKEQSIIRESNCFLMRNLLKVRKQKEAIPLGNQLPQMPEPIANPVPEVAASRRTRGGRSDSVVDNNMAQMWNIFKAICKDLTDVTGEDGANLISKLAVPSKKKGSQYHEVIKKPIDLTQIEAGLSSKQYKTVKAFDDDMLRLFSNAFEFYKDTGSEERKAAEKLQQIYNEKKRCQYNQLLSIFNNRDFVKEFEPVEINELELKPEPNEDIIRCICGLFKDEGLMIECSRCQVWQHAECTKADTEAENYLCERCEPRKVDLEIPLEEYTDEGFRYYLSLLRGNLQIRQSDTVYVLRDIPITPDKNNPDAKGVRKHTYETIGHIEYSDCDIFRVERLWKDKTGKRFVFGHHYLRPHETYHEPSRKFYSNEVVRVPLYEVVPIELIIDRCWVLDPTTYCKGRPVDSSEEHIYICELRVDKSARLFSKISKQAYPICTKSYAFKKFKQKLKISKSYAPHDLGSGVPTTTPKPIKRRKEDVPPRKNSISIVQLRPPPPKTLNEKRQRLENTLSKLMNHLKATNPNFSPKMDLSYLLTGRGARLKTGPRPAHH